MSEAKATEHVTALRDNVEGRGETFHPVRAVINSRPSRQKNAGMTGLSWTPARGHGELNVTIC